MRVHAAALQHVREIAGTTTPAKDDEEAQKTCARWEARAARA